jgi:hypothetical protein
MNPGGDSGRKNSVAALSSLDQPGEDQRRARLTILLFTFLVTVLVVESLATPFVVTVYSKGCWSATTGGVFQRISVQGCGNGSWAMFDLYAVVHPRTVSGSNDLSLVMTEGVGSGGACLGSSICGTINLFLYGPPSPITCQGCIITTALPNPIADWLGVSSATLFVGPDLFALGLIVYLARSLRRVPKIYQSYLRGERERVSWNAFSEGEKTLTVFALGFIGFRSYQFIATILYLYVIPVPTLGFPFQNLVSLMAAVWLVHHISWRYPVKTLPSNLITTIPSGSGDAGDYPQPVSPGTLRVRPSNHRTLIFAIILLGLIVAGIAVPPNYASIQAFFAPKPNIQVAASPSAFTALPGTAANTSILVTGLPGASGNVSLTVDQYPPCNGECTMYLLQVGLSRNLLSTSPGKTSESSFLVNPLTFADPGSYDFLVTATPKTGPPASTIVTVHLAGFNLTASPSVLNFTQSSSIQSTVTVNSFYGYSGSVRLWASADATGPLASLSQGMVTLPAGGSATTTLNVTSQAQGNYQVEIGALSGKLFQYIQLPTTTNPTSSAADFRVTATPANPNVNPGQNENVTIHVSSVNGCICIVHLQVKGNLSSAGPDPLIVSVSPTRSANSTVILMVGEYSSRGQITIVVTGVSGKLIHFADIILNVA